MPMMKLQIQLIHILDSYFQFQRFLLFCTSQMKDLSSGLCLDLGIANGVLLEDLNAGLLSLILPQFIYIFLGSARHCTIGEKSLYRCF